MKKLILIAVTIATGAVLAQAPSPEQKAKAFKEAREKAAKNVEKKGGILERPDSLKGKVAFIDTQSKADLTATLGDVIEKFTKHVPITLVYEKATAGEPEALRKASKAEFAIIITDEPGKPATLIAPEERWAVVNVAKYDAGLKSIEERKDIYNQRCAKAGLKAFMLLCGGGGSRFPGHVAVATKIPDLDLAHDQVPYDIQQGIKSYLKECGVTPRLISTYQRACMEGWAPAPTNDIQKAFYEQAKADKEKGPTNPIKIVPPKK